MKTLKTGLIAAFLMAIATMITMQSCKKDEIKGNINQVLKLTGVPNCNARIEDGILHFETLGDFHKYLEYTNELNSDELKELEKTNNYKSYYSKEIELLNEYRILMEDTNSFTIEKMLDFRKQAQKYITISDTNITSNIEGLCNKVINSEGLVVINSTIYKNEGLKVYETEFSNKSLLINSNHHSPAVKTTDVIKSNGEYQNNQIQQVNVWESKYFKIESHNCRRKRKTNFHVWHYRQPQYRVDGFQVEWDNFQRGWSGIWYAFPMAAKVVGNTHGKNQQYKPINDYFPAEQHDFKNYDVIWYPPGTSMDPNPWAYIRGKFGADQCGWKYHLF